MIHRGFRGWVGLVREPVSRRRRRRFSAAERAACSAGQYVPGLLVPPGSPPQRDRPELRSVDVAASSSSKSSISRTVSSAVARITFPRASSTGPRRGRPTFPISLPAPVVAGWIYDTQLAKYKVIPSKIVIRNIFAPYLRQLLSQSARLGPSCSTLLGSVRKSADGLLRGCARLLKRQYLVVINGRII